MKAVDMKVFVWDNVSHLTQECHSGGGLIVFAETLERARELAMAEGVIFDPLEHPIDIRPVSCGGEKVYIMPDQGCC